MRSILLYRRNPLAYPASVKPGFDPAHVAARNCGFSGVASNGGIFTSLLSGAVGSNATGPSTSTTSLHDKLGRITNYDASADNTAIPFVSSTSQLTLASIFKITSVTGTGGQYIMNVSAAGTAAIAGEITFAAPGNFSGTPDGGTFWDTGVPYVLAVPYFYAASFNGATLNWVIARLDTGKVVSASVALPTAIGAGDGSIWLGNRGANNRALGGGIAAAMAANAFISESQLRQWAQDPWAFWYPRQMEMLVAASAAKYAAFSTPQRDGLTTTQMVGY